MNNRFNSAYDYIKHNNIEMFDKMLNENQIDITQTNQDSYSFLHAAVETNDVKTVKHIMDLFPEESVDEAELKEKIITHALIHVINPKIIKRETIDTSLFNFFTEECIRMTRKSTQLRFPDSSATPKP